jgi:fimbrial isopeptide formation D2 family protein/LPXTG-motif cell wall-anchored protein
MKAIMKMLSVMFAAVMILTVAFGTNANAAENDGSITITPPEGTNSEVSNAYNIYKVFDADTNGTAISYKLIPGKTTAPAGFTVDDAGNVSYTGSGENGQLTENDIVAIATYVANDAPVRSVDITGSTAATVNNLPYGYYYITTTTGSVVAINSTKPAADVKDKNTIPRLDKKARQAEDPTYMELDTDGHNAIAQVGTVIPYEATITVGKGAVGYVFHDKMSDGLAYQNDVKVYVGENEVATTNYVGTAKDGDTLTVTFKDDYLKTLAENTVLTIKYSAKLTSDALSVDPAANTASLNYGDNNSNNKTPDSVVKVYDAKFTVTKKDGEGEPLAGAGFVLMNKDGKYYKLTTTDGASEVTWVDSIDNATEYTSDASGAVTAFTGLGKGEYTLHEKTTPAGYNTAEDSKFTISGSNYTTGNLEQSAEVVNKAGSQLPSTGGMGTKFFYIAGAALAIGAGVVLVARRRMNAQ